MLACLRAYMEILPDENHLCKYTVYTVCIGWSLYSTSFGCIITRIYMWKIKMRPLMRVTCTQIHTARSHKKKARRKSEPTSEYDEPIYFVACSRESMHSAIIFIQLICMENRLYLLLTHQSCAETVLRLLPSASSASK